jgi:predicted Zn-dependent peptidase
MAILYSSSTGSGTHNGSHNGSSAANAGTRIEEARRLAYQAGSNVDTQEEKIRWLRLSGSSTDTAEKTLRTMLKIRDQTIARFMSEAAKDN